MSDPTVSICIPVYNRERLVRQAIESALAQTYAAIEIIVCDNHSTDGTFAVLQEYAARDSRVRAIQNAENLGPVGNWKRCLDLAKGAFVKVLFSDDWLQPDAIEKLVAPFTQYPQIGFVYCTVLMHSAVWPTHLLYSQHDGLLSSFAFLVEQASGITVPVSPCAALFRRTDLVDALELSVPNRLGETRFNQYGIGNDALIYWHLCDRYGSVYHLPEPVVNFSMTSVDEPSISTTLDLGGKGNLLASGYLNAFAYFLAHAHLTAEEKQLLHGLLFVKSMPFNPGKFLPAVWRYSRHFPARYPWWKMRWNWRHVWQIIATRLHKPVLTLPGTSDTISDTP